MLRRGSLVLRTWIAVAVSVSAGAWIGCNELFSITAPVLDMEDAGTADGGTEDAGTEDAGTGDAGNGDAGMDAAPPENCLNGIDDNGDGLVDCADPECQVSYGCAVDPETGWDGLFYVQEITYDPNGAPPSPCPDGKLPAIYYAAPSTAECTSCSCSLSGATCSAPQVTLFNPGGACDPNTALTSIQSNDTSCHMLSVSDTGSFFEITALAKVLSPGTCTADGGALMNPNPWGQEVRLCAVPTGKGCNAGQSCVKDPPSGFQGQTCITQTGTAACPVGWTDQSLQLYGGGTDSRACSSCTCDKSTVVCTGGKYTVNATNDCSVAPGTTSDSVGGANGCVNTTSLSNQNGFSVSLKPELGTPAGLTCGTSSPSGSVTTTGSLQLCCRQVFQ